MALTTNKIDRMTQRNDFMIERNMTVAAGSIIYEGAIVELDGATGHVIPAGTAADLCMGIACEHKVAGENVRIQYNHLEILPIPSPSSTRNGYMVYATDDEILTYTPNTTIVGKQVDVYPYGDKIIVHVCLNN